MSAQVFLVVYGGLVGGLGYWLGRIDRKASRVRRSTLPGDRRTRERTEQP